jgi:hypothetical protein
MVEGCKVDAQRPRFESLSRQVFSGSFFNGDCFLKGGKKVMYRSLKFRESLVFVPKLHSFLESFLKGAKKSCLGLLIFVGVCRP